VADILSNALNVSGGFMGGTAVIFCRVLLEAKNRFDFEMRGLVLDKAWLSFYIKPTDGYQLPEIIQWMKQTLDILTKVTALRDSGNNAETDILVRTAPIPPYLAQSWKRIGYDSYFVKDGWNLAEVEAAFGKDWLTRSNLRKRVAYQCRPQRSEYRL
jgi:hypothetical protein